jgi:hypothetical protein
MITPEQVYNAVEKKAGERGDFNRWLGASAIGHPCTRYISLAFHCAFDNAFTGRTFLIFELGNLAEDLICNALAKAGIEVIERQRQFDMPGGRGHVGATIDGVAVYNNGAKDVVLCVGATPTISPTTPHRSSQAPARSVQRLSP